MTMRLGYVTNGFAGHRLDDALVILAETGYRAVSITLDVHHLDPTRTSPRELGALRRRLTSLDLAATIETGARFLLDPRRRHHPGMLGEECERRVRFIERAMEVASEIGASVVTFASGSAPAGESEEDSFRHLAERCRGLSERARSLGCYASFEPEPGFFVETLDQFDRLRAEVDHPSFGLTLDVGHAHLLESRSPGECVEAFADVLRHVHLEDMRRPDHVHLAIGEGDVDFEAVCSSLARSGFGGVAALELSRDSHRAPEAAREGIERLAPLLPPGASHFFPGAGKKN